MGRMITFAWMSLWACMCAAVTKAAPASPADCSSQLPHLLPCAGFVQGSDKNPSGDCCTGLASVVAANPACLCSLLSSGAAGSINTTRAAELPSMCHMNNVSPSECKGSAGPAPAPVAGGQVPGGSTGAPSEGSHPNAALASAPALLCQIGLITLSLILLTK